jgi:hypothetical protein
MTHFSYSKEIIPHKLRCSPCGDTGKILAVKNDGVGLPYAFRCSYCELGRRRYAFPLWTVAYDDLYTILAA